MEDVRVNDLVEIELNGSRARGTVLRLKERAGATLVEVAVADQCNLWVSAESLLHVSRPVDHPEETPEETHEAEHGTASEPAATVAASEEPETTFTPVTCRDVLSLHWYALVNGRPCRVLNIRDNHTVLVRYDNPTDVSIVDWNALS